MVKAKRAQLEIVSDNLTGADDKRIFCRFALDDVPVRFKDLKIGERGSCLCKDIGGGGAGLEVSQEVRTKTPLELWFDLPDGFEPMHLLGKVAWAQPSGSLWKLGVTFDRAKLMSMARILRIVA